MIGIIILEILFCIIILYIFLLISYKIIKELILDDINKGKILNLKNEIEILKKNQEKIIELLEKDKS